MKLEEKEELIKHYSYYYNDSEDFVEEYLENYKEMDLILENVLEGLYKKNMYEKYNIKLCENGINLENKKTKESYSIRIEF